MSSSSIFSSTHRSLQLSIDELKEELRHLPERERIDLLHEYAWVNIDLYPKECYDMGMEVFELAKKIGYAKGIGLGHFGIAYYGMHIRRTENAKEHYEKALDIFQSIGFKEGIARTLGMISYAHWWVGEYDKGFEKIFDALRLAEEANNSDGIGWCTYALGVFYFDMKDYSTSESYYLRALEKFSEIGHDYAIARARGGLGSVYIALDDHEKALEYINDAMDGYRRLKHAVGEARALNDIGLIHRTKGNYNEAEKHLLRALQLREEAQYLQGIITTLHELGYLYLISKQHDRSLAHLTRALELAQQANTKPKLFKIHQHLAELYKELQQPWKALEHMEAFYSVKSEVNGEQMNNRIKQLQTEVATEKAEKEAEIHRLKNIELKQLYEDIEEKNKHITDSINYARLIQQAILPSDEDVHNAFPDSFVLYLPKDVVSGDFYWFSRSGNKRCIAAVDCTGHGVPGAFMSMIGNTLLNEIINEKNITCPGDVLFKLREGVIKLLRQSATESRSRDGMDIALCLVEDSTLKYAGANNPLWMMRDGVFTEIKADKQPIGIYAGEARPFTPHTISIQPGDCFYIFTDGYADQFGGKDGKKFKYRQLQQLLADNHTLPMNEQKNLLHKTLLNWQGNLEQVDDVLVIGFRV